MVGLGSENKRRMDLSLQLRRTGGRYGPLSLAE